MSNFFIFLTAHGKISEQLVMYVLSLPIIMMFVAFSRQVIGIKMFGAYAPVIATYAFLGTGLIPGFLLSLLIFLSAIILRFLTRQLRIHYLPRMAILVTLICIIFLLILPFTISLPDVGQANMMAMSVILFITLSDIYLTAQVKNGFKAARKLYLETIVTAAIIFLIITSHIFRNLLMQYPEVIILALVVDLLMGQWKGLRLTEIIRFRSVIKEKSKEYV